MLGSIHPGRTTRRALAAAVIAAGVAGTIASGAVLPLSYQRRAPDVDGDGVPDPTTWRLPSSGVVTNATFYIGKSSTGYTQTVGYELGQSGDYPVLGDYDGDGKTDLAVYRPDLTNAWLVRLSSQNFTSITTYQWGLQDLPVPGDYDGDGRMDIAVFRPADGGWYVLQGGNTFKSAFVIRWGGSTSTPVPADYDGDGRLDVAVYEPLDGTWYILQGGTNFRSAFAQKLTCTNNGRPVPGDYDGDGGADLACWDPANFTFTILYRAGGYKTTQTVSLGQLDDLPVPGDWDGDKKVDLVVFRPATGTYYILQASKGFASGFTRSPAVGGTSTDQPALVP